MKLKTKWTYQYRKNLREPMISADYYLEGENLYFALDLGLSAFDSVLLELNLKTQQARTIYEEKHVVRTAGIHEDGKIYFTSFRGMAYCLNLDGSICWATKISSSNPSSKITLDGDRFYVSDHSIFCLDKHTGKILWKNEIFNQKVNCNILCDDQYLYCGELGGRVFCLDKFTGEARWVRGKNEWINNIAFLAPDRLLVNHCHGRFYIVDAKSGDLINILKAKGYLYTPPVFEKHRMYIGAGNDVIHSTAGNMTCYEFISPDVFKTVFSVSVAGSVTTKAVIDGDRLFFAAEDNYLYCVDKNTGDELMPRKKTKGICRNIIVDGNELIVLSDKGQIECFEIK